MGAVYALPSSNRFSPPRSDPVTSIHRSPNVVPLPRTVPNNVRAFPGVPLQAVPSVPSNVTPLRGVQLVRAVPSAPTITPRLPRNVTPIQRATPIGRAASGAIRALPYIGAGLDFAGGIAGGEGVGLAGAGALGGLAGAPLSLSLRGLLVLRPRKCFIQKLGLLALTVLTDYLTAGAIETRRVFCSIDKVASAIGALAGKTYSGGTIKSASLPSRRRLNNSSTSPT